MKSAITYITPNDVQCALDLTDEQTSLITQEHLDIIAARMCDDYLNQLFWSSLEILGKECLKNILDDNQDEEDENE
jgi:hypothetical protein